MPEIDPVDAYETLADRFAQRVENKAHNAHYEQPAMRAAIGDPGGRRALDLGCGPGVLAQWMVERGATVTAVDASARMVAHAKARLGERARVLVHDLREPPLPVPDASVDLLTASLVLDYLPELPPLFDEAARVLVEGGRMIASMGHPMFELRYSPTGRYFDTEYYSVPWRGFGGEPVEVPSYRRPLSAISAALADAGFVIQRIVEPRPTQAFRDAAPEDYAELMRAPGFLLFDARLA